MLEGYIGTVDAARILGVSRQAVDYMANCGKLEFDCIGGARIFRLEDVTMLDTARRAGMTRTNKRKKLN